MCGIAGIASLSPRPDLEPIVREMTDALHHRGPDASGIYSRTANGVSVALGHRRLSIIDLSDVANQPLGNEDGSIQLVFNGEVYNFKALRAELIAAGHTFRTETDSEVIVHGYEEWGQDVAKRLNGMFAFAIWDSRRQRLVLARDRFGKKPLYYFRTVDSLIFASEIKGLFRHPACPRELDIFGVSRYLLHEYTPAPYTLIKNIFKVMPGHTAVFDASGYREQRYWNISFENTIAYRKQDEDEVADRVHTLLRESVERRLMSDVPLGLFLSGGVDSTAILAMMSELAPGGVRSFSIGFDEPSFDESRFADMAARHFGAEHSRHMLTQPDLVSVLDEIWDFMDDPIADGSLIPTYILSKFTRGSVTVALSGEGGDELFAGYDPFVADKAADLYGMVPGFVRRTAEPLLMRLPVSRKNMSFDFRVKHFLKGFNEPEDIRHQIWLGSFSPKQQDAVFSERSKAILGGFSAPDLVRERLATCGERDRVDRTTCFYCKFYMRDCLLPKIDRSSMAVSLEVRSPFLDVELAEYVNRLDSRYKLNGLKRKYILKKAMQNSVPNEILHRKKKGFGMPVAKLLRRELRELGNDVFSRNRIAAAGIFDPDGVHALWSSHQAGTQDNRKLLWTLLMFEMWRERFMRDAFRGPAN